MYITIFIILVHFMFSGLNIAIVNRAYEGRPHIDTGGLQFCGCLFGAFFTIASVGYYTTMATLKKLSPTDKELLERYKEVKAQRDEAVEKFKTLQKMVNHTEENE